MIRVLFVDDETPVLEAMKRTMHRMRNEWSMEFQSSGPAALEALAKRPADVVVSDMKMPGMDGWELLREVKRLYPQSVRLVLSGYAEAGAIMEEKRLYEAHPALAGRLLATIPRLEDVAAIVSSQSGPLSVAGKPEDLKQWDSRSAGTALLR